MHSAVMEGLVWARVAGDSVFSVGVLALALFVYQVFTDKVASQAWQLISRSKACCDRQCRPASFFHRPYRKFGKFKGVIIP
jgi:hypothetical protein